MSALRRRNEMYAILAAMNTTKLVAEMRPEKIQARTGFEPISSAIPVQRSSN